MLRAPRRARPSHEPAPAHDASIPSRASSSSPAPIFPYERDDHRRRRDQDCDPEAADLLISFRVFSHWAHRPEPVRRRSPGASPPRRGARSGARRRSRRDPGRPRRRSPPRPAAPTRQLLEPRAGGNGLAAIEVDQLARRPVADRPPDVLLDQAVRQVRQRLALVERARERAASAYASAARAATRRGRAARRRCGSRPSGSARCGRTLHQSCVCSVIEPRPVEERDVRPRNRPSRRRRRGSRSAGTCA